MIDWRPIQRAFITWKMLSLSLSVSRLWTYSALLWRMACRRLTMSVASSATARRLCTHCESCAPTAGVTRRCRPSTNRSSSPSYCMRPLLGQDLLRRPTDSESTHSSAAAPAAAFVHQTFRRSTNCLKYPTSSSSAKLSTTGTTYYTITFHLRLQPHRTMTSDPGYTTDNYLTALVISQTVISSPASYTMTYINWYSVHCIAY